MRSSRFTDKQIIGIVREADAGAPAAEVCRRSRVSPATFYNWKAWSGGMGVSDARRLRQLEEENRKGLQRASRLQADRYAPAGGPLPTDRR